MVQTLEALILSIEDWQNKNETEIAQILNEKNIEDKDVEYWSWAGVYKLIGNENLQNLRAVLIAQGYDWACDMLAGKGLVLSDPDTQEMLASLALAGIPGASELKEAGISFISTWENAGHSGVVTTTVVKQTTDTMKSQDRKNELLVQGAAEYNQFVDMVNSWDGVGSAPRLVAFPSGN